MYKILILCFNASLLFLLVCCSSPEMRKLEQLEQYADVNPSGVLAVLDSMDISDGSRTEQALYALLYSQAQYKCYIAAQSDSLIRIASDYYEHSREVRRRMLAHYYLACVQYEIGNYGQSIISASKAEKDAIEIGDNYYLGLIYSQISDSYDHSYNKQESLKYVRLARKAYVRAGKSRHELFTFRDEGRLLTSMTHCDSAIHLLRSIISLPDVKKDSTLYTGCLVHYANALALSGDYDEAKQVYDILHNSYHYNWDVNDLCRLARIYENQNKWDSAKACIRLAEQMARTDLDSIHILTTYVNSAFLDKDYQLLYNSQSKMLDIQNKAILDMYNRTVTSQHRDYFRRQAQIMEERSASERRLFAVCFISLCGFAILGVLFYREKGKRKLAELNQLIETVREVNGQMVLQQEHLSLVQQRVKHLFGEQFGVLDQLVNTYLDHEGSNRNATAVLKELELAIASFSSPKKIKELEAVINDNFNNIIHRLRNQIPIVTDTEVRLFLYLSSRFSSRAIALFMGEKIENIYNKKSRLKKKIMNSEAVDKEEFLDFFV